MDTGFNGRKKEVTGKAGIKKRGDGIGASKPAGKDVSYSKRREGAQNHAGGSGYSNSQGTQERSVTRGLGGSKLILIVIAVALLFGGKNILNLFGGG